MNQAAFQALLQCYLNGECTAAEAAKVEAWYATLRRGQPAIWRAGEQEQTSAKLWRGVAARLRPQPRLHAGRRRLRWTMATLAVLSLAMGLLAVNRLANPAPTWVLHRNATGPVQQFTLPDGSWVRLLPGSTLRYRSGLAGSRREVYLTGEAFFDVRHNAARPFQVYTWSLVTTVLGTAFSVRAFVGQPAALVRVERGSVRVSARTATAPTFRNTETNPASVVLLPNQQVVYAAKPGRAPRLHKTLADKPVLLTASQRLFTNEPVGQVLAALSQDYGVAIAYNPAALQGCTVNLAFTHETLYQRLDLLCQTLGASYERTDEQILFHSTGCTGN